MKRKVGKMWNRIKAEARENIPVSLLSGILITSYSIFHPRRHTVMVFPSSGVWAIVRNGRKYYCPTPSDYNLSKSKFFGEKVFNRYTFKDIGVKKGDIVLDVGSFIGGFALPAAEKASLVIAVEPDPLNCFCLRKNIENSQNKIRVVQKLAWYYNGKVELNLSNNPEDHSALRVDSKSRGESIKVNSLRLDTLVKEMELNQINFLKIEAEGAEPEVLEGTEGIMNRIDKIAVNCGSERFGKSPSSEVRKFLEGKGFKVYSKEGGHILWGRNMR